MINACFPTQMLLRSRLWTTYYVGIIDQSRSETIRKWCAARNRRAGADLHEFLAALTKFLKALLGGYGSYIPRHDATGPIIGKMRVMVMVMPCSSSPL